MRIHIYVYTHTKNTVANIGNMGLSVQDFVLGVFKRKTQTQVDRQRRLNDRHE